MALVQTRDLVERRVCVWVFVTTAVFDRASNFFEILHPAHAAATSVGLFAFFRQGLERDLLIRSSPIPQSLRSPGRVFRGLFTPYI